MNKNCLNENKKSVSVLLRMANTQPVCFDYVSYKANFQQNACHIKKVR